jgi:hypothetical protein
LVREDWKRDVGLVGLAMRGHVGRMGKGGTEEKRQVGKWWAGLR